MEWNKGHMEKEGETNNYVSFIFISYTFNF